MNLSSISFSSSSAITNPSLPTPLTLKRSRSTDHPINSDLIIKSIAHPFFSESPFQLPLALETPIFSMLSFKELKLLTRVCKAGRRNAQNQTLQKLIMLNQIPLASKTLSAMSEKVDWTLVYRNHTHIPKCVKHIWYHQMAVSSSITSVQAIGNLYLIGTPRCIYVQLDRRAEGISDEIIMTLEHTATMNAFVVKDNLIISGNGSEARVWDLNTGTCVRNVKSLHTREIKSLTILRNTIVSGSLDGTVCTWDLNSEEPARLIGKQTGGVYALKIHELAGQQEVFCGSDQGELNAFNFSGLKTFSYKYPLAISAIDIHRDQLAVGTFAKIGSNASTAHIWDLTARKETTSFITSRGVTRTLCLADHNRLATVSLKSFRLWDINKKNRTTKDAIKEFSISDTIAYAISITERGFLISENNGSVTEFCYFP